MFTLMNVKSFTPRTFAEKWNEITNEIKTHKDRKIFAEKLLKSMGFLKLKGNNFFTKDTGNAAKVEFFKEEFVAGQPREDECTIIVFYIIVQGKAHIQGVIPIKNVPLGHSKDLLNYIKTCFGV
jgi:hypothetical protein